MVNRGRALVLALAVLFSFTSAEIKELKLKSDPRPLIIIDKFGFTQTGHVSISVSDVYVSCPISPPIPSSIGFFLVYDEYIKNIQIQLDRNPSICPLYSHFVTTLATFRSVSPPPYSFNKSFPINTTSLGPFSLFFSNCHPQTSISMSVRTELYNLDPVSTTSKVYLSPGLTQLPTIFLIFSLCYFLLWIGLCFTTDNLSHRLMAGLLLAKALHLFCAAEEKHYVKATGTPHGWNVFCYIFESVSVVALLFLLIVTCLKTLLKGRENKVIMIVIPVQVIANLASTVIGETWNEFFLLVDIFCCYTIIAWSNRSLSKTKGNFAKLSLFRRFYIVVIGYFYFTRVVVFGLRTVTTYKYQWVNISAEEAVSLAFYILISYLFRLAEKNKNFGLDDEEEEEEKASEMRSLCSQG